MLQSMDEDQLHWFIEEETKLSQLSRSNRALSREVADMLEDTYVGHDRTISQQKHICKTLQGNLQHTESRISSARLAQKAWKDSLETRRKRIAAASDWLRSQRASLERDRVGLNIDKSVLASVKMSLMQRRAHLVLDLASIFPVESVDAATLLFSICGLALPNASVDVRPFATMLQYRMDDDSMASALGYVAQATALLAAYLAVPLYYPLRCVGSRSLVQDPISQIKGSKIFPLYSKGVDRYRYDYALFLLNKDIEQLMIESGIVVLDIRQTLPNLKTLYLTLSTDASQP